MVCPPYNKETLPLLNNRTLKLPGFGAEKENLLEAAWVRPWLCPLLPFLLSPLSHALSYSISCATSTLPPPPCWVQPPLQD